LKIAVIVAVYNDLEALKLVIESLQNQTHIPDEIIVAEDAQHEHIANYIQNLDDNLLIHISQEDKSWRKEKILNEAIKVSKSDYLIFIDGDCVPFKNFVKSHFELAEEKTALCGRRTEPGLEISKKLKSKKLSTEELEKNYIKYYLQMNKDNVRHYEEGLYFPINSIRFYLVHILGRKDSHIVGCNWSCYKNDLIAINGYDEDFTLPTNGEDTDIERRLTHFNIKMKSCRNAANVIHLFHEKSFNKEITQKTKAIMNTKKDIFICKNGLEKIL